MSGVRLNLLRLLAYIDKVGSPEDLAQLKLMVEESEPAKQLVERIEKAIRRKDLTAPPPLGNEKYDLNLVAEYLDWTMPAEQWSGFEQHVLHSEALLAELAGSHHALKLVLEGPPHFEAALREKMKAAVQHGLAHPPVTEVEPAGVVPPPPLNPAHLAAAAGSAPPLGVTRPAEEVERIAEAVLKNAPPVPTSPIAMESASLNPELREKPSKEIPAYLVDEPAGLPAWAIPGGLILVVLLAVGAAFVAGQSFFGPPDVAKLPPAEGSTAAASTAGSTAASGHATTHEATTVAAATSAIVPTTVPTVPPESTAATVPTAPPAPTVIVVPPPAPTPAATAAATAAPETTKAATTAGDSGPKPPAVPEKAAAPVVDVADYGSSDSILLIYNRLASTDAAPIWNRLAPRSRLRSDDRFVVPPSFRTIVEYSPNLSVEIVGPAIGTFQAPTAEGVPQLHLVEGRLLVRGKDGAKVKLSALDGERTKVWTVELGKDPSLVGIEINPLRPIGSDPRTVVATEVAAAFTLGEGTAAFDDGRQKVEANVIWQLGQLAPVGLTSVSTKPVAWVKGGEISPLERSTTLQLRQELSTDQSIEFRLREIEATNQARQDVRTLILRTLALLGSFDRLVVAISQEDFRPNFRDQLLETARGALAWGPSYAVAVETALADPKLALYEPQQLYRMLWGYTDAQLAQGDAARLVAALDSEHFLHRTLSFVTLKEITGGITLGYNPLSPASQRQKVVKQWRDKLASGEIKHKVAAPQPPVAAAPPASGPATPAAPVTAAPPVPGPATAPAAPVPTSPAPGRAPGVPAVGPPAPGGVPAVDTPPAPAPAPIPAAPAPGGASVPTSIPAPAPVPQAPPASAPVP